MRERDSREEDKEEGRGLGEGSSSFWEKLGGKKFWKRGRGGGNWKNILFWGTLTGTLLLLELWARGPGNCKDSWS
jgi:hypothetical protein